MKVLIIGASGLVGSHCFNYFKEKEFDVIGTHRNFETNDTYFFDPSFDNCFDFLDEIKFKPDVIIHCAALTNVDYCEDHEDESEKLTVNSTEKIADFCDKRNIKLVFLSTDYVFDGSKGPYVEDDATNPINIYGNHKLKAESIVLKIKDYLIVRVTNVYGEEDRSKNFIAFLLSVIDSKTEKSLSIAQDQFATPVYARDIARMIFLLLLDKKEGVYHLSSTDYYSRFQLANKIKSNYKASDNLIINPARTQNLKQKALRPLRGGLLNIKFSNEYPDFEYTNIDTFICKKK